MITLQHNVRNVPHHTIFWCILRSPFFKQNSPRKLTHNKTPCQSRAGSSTKSQTSSTFIGVLSGMMLSDVVAPKVPSSRMVPNIFPWGGTSDTYCCYLRISYSEKHKSQGRQGLSLTFLFFNTLGEWFLNRWTGVHPNGVLWSQNHGNDQTFDLENNLRGRQESNKLRRSQLLKSGFWVKINLSVIVEGQLLAPYNLLRIIHFF